MSIRVWSGTTFTLYTEADCQRQLQQQPHHGPQTDEAQRDRHGLLPSLKRGERQMLKRGVQVRG